MVLTLKRWKSRASPGITAGGHGKNPFTCQGLFGLEKRARCGPFFIFGIASAVPRPTWGKHGDAGWSSPVARQAHNLKVAGSNPAPATNKRPRFGGVFCWFGGSQGLGPRSAGAAAGGGDHAAQPHKSCPRNQQKTPLRRGFFVSGTVPWRDCRRSPHAGLNSRQIYRSA